MSKPKEGINTLTIIPDDGSKPFVIDSDEAAYSATIDSNPNMDSPILRYRYESLATPDSIIDYNVNEKVVGTGRSAGGLLIGAVAFNRG